MKQQYNNMSKAVYLLLLQKSHHKRVLIAVSTSRQYTHHHILSWRVQPQYNIAKPLLLLYFFFVI